MRIAVASDEWYPVHQTVIDQLIHDGHELVLIGAMHSKEETEWADVAKQAALAVQSGACQEGIIFCWTGTGISMAANKVPGIRAALCTDAQTARAARIWNHANVLALSNRLLSQDVAKEILAAWFEDFDREIGAKGVAALND